MYNAPHSSLEAGESSFDAIHAYVGSTAFEGSYEQTFANLAPTIAPAPSPLDLQYKSPVKRYKEILSNYAAAVKTLGVGELPNAVANRALRGVLSDEVGQSARQRVRAVSQTPQETFLIALQTYFPTAPLTEEHITVVSKRKSPHERIQAMDALAAKYAHLPVLPDSAFDRETIYEDRL